MTVAEQLYKEAQTLPENMQIEALHYIEFLKQKLGLVTDIIPAETVEMSEDERDDKLLEIMLESQQHGTAFDNIDVMAWQKEVRKDRPLPFRDKE